jgi:hypothetical protein
VGRRYGRHSARLGSDGAEKACGAKANERHHETVISSRDRRVLAGAKARRDGDRQCQSAADGLEVWESRRRGVVWVGGCKESGLDEDKLAMVIDASGGFKS